MNSLISVVDKASHNEVAVQGTELTLHEPSVVRLNSKRSDIKHIERDGDTLVLTMASGVVIKVHGFFAPHGPQQNDLVLQDGPHQWLMGVAEDGQLTGAFASIDSIEPLLLNEHFDLSTLAWVLGGLALLGGAAAAGGGGGGGQNSAPAQNTLTLAAPTVSVQTNADGSVTVTGSAPAGSTVLLTYPDGSTGSVVAASDGHYSASSAPNQPSGTIAAHATDSRGHDSSTTSANFVDTTSPVAPTVVVSANPDGTLSVSGSAEPGSSVAVTYPDGTTSTVVADASGHYSTSSSTVQASGNVVATATDVAGNTSAATTNVFADSTAPLAPSENFTANVNGTLTVSGSAEPGSTVTITYPDGTTSSTVADASGHYSTSSTTVQTSGNVRATATDVGGNTSAPVIAAYIDNTAPLVPSQTASFNPDGTLTVIGTAEPGSTVVITYADGTTSSTVADALGHFSTGSTTQQGSSNVRSTATDLAGNTSLPITRIDIDRDAPLAPTENVSANPDGTLTVSGTAEPGSTVTITYPDGTTSSVVADASGNYSTSSTTVQTSGNVVATATDVAGNTSAPTTSAYTDSTAPLAPVQNISANPDGTLTVSGTAEPGSTVTVTYPDGTSSTVVADASGNYSTSSSTVQTSGNVVATATDAAGNTSAPTTSAYTDSTAPLAPVQNVSANPDGTLTVSGTAEPGSTVTITYPDGTTSSVVADASGNYSTSSGTVQTSGNVVATATDAAGNTSAPSTSAYTDSTAPLAPVQNISANPDGTLTVSGTAEPGSTVTITYPDGTTSSVVADASGNYSTSSGTVQTSGNVVATATDAAGNTSAPSTSAYTDSTAPLAPVQNISANPDGTLTVSGTAEPGSTVTITYPDGTSSTAVADASGNYSTGSTTVQTSGNVVATATDAAGNTSAPATSAYTDSTAPLAPTESVSANPDGTLTVSGTAEPGSTVTITYPDGTTSSVVADASGNYSTSSGTVQTSGNVVATATDAAGNTSAPSTSAYTDSTAPLAPVQNISANPDGTLTVSGTAEPGSTVTITYPDGTTSSVVADASGNYSTSSSTVQTSGNVTATATDVAGNTSAPTTSAYTDSTAPLAPVQNISANPDGTLTVSGTAEPGSTVTITYPDGTTSSVVADASGNYSTGSTTVQTSGNVVATATDAAGNTSAPSTSAYTDSTAPLAPTESVSANPDGTLTVSGTAEPGSTVTVTYPDGTSSTAVADASGNYSTSSSTVQTSGNVTATATDAAGNSSAPTTSAYTDSTAPLAPVQNISANPDGTLTVSGTAEPGSTVTITYPDGTTSSVVADASGNYSTSSSTVQTSGNVVATATDAAGNTSAPATSAYTDSTAPLAPVQNISANPDGTLTVSGTAEPGSTVTITYPDGTTSSVVADASGNYSTSSGTVQTSGNVVATATDAAGNTSAPSTSAYTDSTAPLAPVQNISANPDGTLTVSGTAEPGSTVTITYPDGTTSSVVADASGNYSTGSTTVQTSGNVVATATDAAGNTSAPATSAYTDSTAPLAPVQNISANPDGTLTVSGTAEPGSTVTITYPDGTTSSVVADASGNYSTGSTTVQTSGNVVATATDAAGNTSAPATSAYTDSTAPLAPVQNVSANPDGTLTVSGTAEPGSTVTVTYPDGTSSTAVVDASGNYSTGSTTVQTSGNVVATATDAAGNTSAPATSAYTDSTAPLAPVQNVSANPDGTLTVSGTAEPGSTVTVTYPDGTSSTAVVDASGNYSTGSTTVQTSGNVVATATDAAGNTSAPSTSAYTDSTAPLAPAQNISANPDGTLTVSGTAEPGSTVTVTYPDGTSSTVVADASGNYSTSSSTVQTSGNVVATATDAAGNTSAPTTSAYTDSTAPLAPVQNVSANPDGTLTVSGTAEPGSTVTITYPDGTTSSVVADASGNYSTSSGTVQTSGNVTATATDAAGNTSAPSTSAYTDSTAPLAPVQNISANPDGTLTVSGTAEPGSTVTITYPDGTTSSVVADASGNYSTGSTTVQTSGNVVATATDAAGNTSAPSTSAYTDSTAPLAPTESVSANPDGTLTVSGTAEPGSTVTVTYPDGTSSTVVADASGNYSTGSTTVQTSGNVVATATDAAGNTSAPATSAYTDSTAPLAPVQNISANPDGTLTVSGTAEPGSTVTVTYPDGTSSTVVADASGNYSTSSSTVQTSGNVVATATDAAGNTSAPTTSAYTDSTAPLAPVQNVSANPDGTLTVSGTAEPGSTVTITYPDGTTSSVVADASGNYSTSSGTVQTSGNVTATATDAAGNTSAPSTSAYTDSTAPLAPVQNISANPDGTLTVSGTAEPGSTVTITYPDGTTSSVVADASGNYSTSSSTVQTSGNVTATATDVAGNTSAPTTSAYTDSTAPLAPVQNISANPDGTLTVSGTAEPGSTVTVTYPDGTSSTAVADASGNYSTGSTTVQTSGNVVATATDAAGNTSAPATSAYTDSTAPLAPTESVSANPDGTLTVSGTAEPGSTVTVTYPDGTSSTVVADASGNYSTSSSTVQTSGNVVATATDAAGNTSAPATSAYTDSTAPLAPVQNISANPDGTLTVSGTAEPGSTVTITYPDGTTSSVVADASGNYSTSSGTVQTSGNVVATATDAAGNTSAPSTSAYTDSTAPLAPVQNISANPDGTLTVSGTAEPGSTVTITYPDGTTSSVVADASGNYSTSSSTVQTSGNVTATATDVAGNTSAPTTSAYTDSTAPLAPVQNISANPDGTLTVSGTAEPGSTVTITYPDGTTSSVVADASGNYSTGSTTVQTSGNVVATATDAAGNTSAPATSAYTDSTAPLAPVQNISANPDGTLTVSGTAEPGSTVTITYPDGTSSSVVADASGNYSTSSSTVQTSGNVVATATDAAGNTSAPSTSAYTDSTAPLAPVQNVSANPDGTLTVSGTAEPGSTVTITYPDGTTSSVVADASGNYSTSSGTVQTSGNVVATATDAAGNTSAPSTSAYTDNTAPLAPTESVSANPDGTLTVSGTAEPGSTVTITYPDGSTSSVVTDAAGHYSSVSSTAQISGNVQAIATDVAGNSSAPTNSAYLNTFVPTATATISAITDDTGHSANDYLTSDTTLVVSATLSGTLSASLGDKVQISVDGGLTWHDASPLSGNTYTYDNTGSSLASGSYQFEARVVNLAGNASTAGTQAVNIDTSAPSASATIAISAVTSDTGASSSDFTTSDNTLVFNGSLGTPLGAGEGVRISLDGGATWQAASVSGTTWSYDNSANVLADGTYNVQVQVIDTAGNVGQTASQNVLVDTTVPAASATIAFSAITSDTGASSSDFVTSDNTLVFNGTLGTPLAAGEGVQISLDGGATWQAAVVSGSTWSYDNSASSLVDGTYALMARVVDLAGNVGQSASQSLLIDSGAPSATVSISAITTDTGTSSSDFVTSDNSLVVSAILTGTLGAGESVQISLDGGLSWNTASLVSGSTYALDNTANSLADGSYNVQARVLDTAGNVGNLASQVVVVDTSAPTTGNTVAITSYSDNVAPQVGNFGDTSSTNDSTPLLNGSVSGLNSGDIVQVYQGATLLGNATVSGGTWSYQLNTLTDGDYAYHAVITDASGNQGSSSAIFNLTVDTSAPSATQTVAITAINSDTGVSSSDFITADNTLVFSGTLGAALASGEGVQLSLDGGSTWFAASVSGTTWSYDNSASVLADGSYSIQARVVDAAGNLGQNTSHNLTVDTLAPTATVSIVAISLDSGSSASDFITADNTLVISGTLGTALAVGDSVQVSLDGGSTWQAASVSGTTWSYDNTASVMADGSYSLQARVVDGAGNVGHSASQSLVIDTTAPSTSIAFSSITQDTGTSASDFNTSDNTLVFNGTLGGLLALGEGVRISLNGGTTWNNASVSGATWSFDNSASILADGTYNLVAQVIDSAGNVGSSVSQLLVVDTTAPTVLVTIGSVTSDTGASASDFITSDHTLLFQGTLSASLNSGEGVQFSIDGGVTYLIASVSGTTWSYDYTGTALADGTYNLKARVFDGAGNIGLTANQTLLIDSSVPIQTIAISAITTDTGSSGSDFVTNDKTLEFTGTLGAVLGGNEGVEISLDGGTSWQAASVTGSTWTFDNTGNSLADGTYNVQARVIDTAGNVGNLASQTLVVDSTAPSATATISAISQDAGSSASDFVTNDQTLLVNASLIGVMGSGESLQISLDGGATWQTATLLSGNTYQLDNTANTLAAGSYTFQARVIDQAGNISSVSSQAVVISTSGPAVTALALTAISTDTNAGLALGTASTTNTATNSDLVTRDTLLTLSGTYTGTLASGDLLQLSSDGGITWNNTTYNTGTHTWSYVDATAHTSAVSYQLRTVSQAGTVGTITATQTVTVDTTAPLQNLLMPTLGSAFDSGVLGDHVTTNTSMTFTSAQSRTGSAGDSVLLINDINNDGVYSEGIDSVLASATVAANGSWSLSASGLAVGSYHLGFMQVDAAGNRSRLSLTSEVDVVAANDHAAAASTGWGGNTAGSTENKGTAYTLGSNGLWTFYSNLSVYSSTGLATYSATSLATGADNTVNNVTFVDYNRDGNLDILGVDNNYPNGQQSWSYNGTTYTAFQIAGTGGSANVYNLHGTLVAYDKTGDGFTELAYGEALNAGDSHVPGGVNSQLLVNNSGTFTKDSNFVQTPNGVGVSSITAQPYGEISGVDINNDGNVDLVFHQRNPAFAANNTLSVLNNNGTGALSVTFTLGGVFANPVDNSSTPSMTWADFNNDGYLDLFVGGGVTGSSGAAGTASESRSYTNNQSGGLNATPTWFGDTLVGGASLAVDWNRDGAMDVIELPDIAAAASPINLYTNNGTGTSWSTSILATGVSGVTGAVAVDYNWDGAVDLIYFRTGSVNAQWVQNTNSVQYGTSLHLRILDASGLTSYYGNTVQLYDASGKRVASQIINPQSGSNTNDSSSIVNFYGLDANQTYTAVLVRNLAGASADVGGLASLGGNAIENVNASWTGLVAGAANNAYVLSAESGSNTANGSFIGTGYNDTLFATAGTDTYNGSGGWNNTRFGAPTWSATGGEDVLDFKLAGNTGVTVNLNTATAQATGFNTSTLAGIEGLRGASGDDQFTARTTAGVNNLFEGRGGNDSFILGATGGHATLVYNLLNGNDPTGGNGSDTASGFVLGSVASTANADVIDLTSLLASYSGTAYVYRDVSSGSYVLDYASQGLNQYLQVTNDGSNSYVRVDLTGTGTFAASNLLLTLTGVVTDLPTLLANNQLLVASSATGGLSVVVNSQSTVDTTPIVSGSIPYALPSGGHLEVTVNGVTYSSVTGAVVVDPNNNTWYVQVPGGNALAVGTYEVSAVVVNSNGQVALQDLTSNELSVLAAPSGTTTVQGETANISAVGMAVGDVNNDGLFDYFNATGIYYQSGTANATSNTFTGLNLYTEGTGAGQIGKVSAVQFLDFMRTGNIALMTSQQNFSQGYFYFVNNGDGASYTLTSYSVQTTASGGSQVGIDLNNDGYVDLVTADKWVGDSGSYSLNNVNGTFTNYDAGSSGDPASQSVNGAINENFGAFDLNGDGRVDLIGQFWSGTWGGTINDMAVLLTGAGGSTSALAATTALGTLKRVANVYYHENGLASYQAGAQSVNVADFNGDGKLDLFVGQTVTHGAGNSIYTSDGAGNFTLATTLGSSTLTGGVSLNTDWNGDGKLDVFEFADNGTSNNTLATRTSFEYWQNTTASVGAAPTFSRTLMSVSSVASATSIISAVAADFNYDGAQDLLINANGNDVLVVNPNAVAAGTSLHLKILSPTGTNTYVSQTVNLYDSTGTLVQTRVINAQYGYGTNDSRGVVDFYGLNANMTYTLVLVKGATGIDGGEGSISGSASLGIPSASINSTWTGLTPAAASHGYVLVADATNDSTSATFIGTGYDDTFFAGLGNNTYSGSGGWETVSATPIWSNTGGTDIVDFKLAGSTALTIDLSNSGAQSTGFNTATFKNIEGIAGGSGNDTFTDSSGNNNFEGRGGNDTFNLTHGGHDTLVYHVLAGATADNTAGNGSDTVNGFKVGTWEGTPDTPRLDIHELLVGYTGDGSASYQNNVATLGAGAGNIASFVQVTQSGANTVIAIDRDGSGGANASTTLVTLNNVHTDLATLLANHQLTVV
ncbi:FG-GAP-like repeat-containing protein [Pseudomonas protegens]|uniref:Ig-like domain-containing protein n=1 Tax=Pseudomonas protegens TaxID=380021 RepID=UPI001C8F19D0|nr:Ig-like domain-containing protein [Pseudomonas protegens]QZI68267.1 FG-GAP-like repeat-containing protein [Pseudomonas protegens]